MTQPSPSMPPGDVLERVMREHDGLAPDGDVIAARVLTRVGDPVAPRRRTRPLLAVGLVAASVATVAGVVQLGARPEWADRAQAPTSPSEQVATDPGPTTPNPEPDDALLDPLTYRLTLGRPQRDGSVPSTLTVTNPTGRPVTDPACRHASNYDYGVVALDRPDAPLRGRVITKCGGSVDLPAGYVATYDGPRFETRGLAPGDYLATLDFGDARTDRLTAPLRIEGP
jgi:hypothetical protein